MCFRCYCQLVRHNLKSDIWLHQGLGRQKKLKYKLWKTQYPDPECIIKNIFDDIDQWHRKDIECTLDKPQCLWFSAGTWFFNPYSHKHKCHDETFPWEAIACINPKRILHIKTKVDIENFVDTYHLNKLSVSSTYKKQWIQSQKLAFVINCEGMIHTVATRYKILPIMLTKLMQQLAARSATIILKQGTCDVGLAYIAEHLLTSFPFELSDIDLFDFFSYYLALPKRGTSEVYFDYNERNERRIHSRLLWNGLDGCTNCWILWRCISFL